MSKETKLDKYQERANLHLQTYVKPIKAKVNSRVNGEHLLEVDKVARALGISRSELVRVMLIQATKLGPDCVFVGDLDPNDVFGTLHWKTEAEHYIDAYKKAEEQVLHWKTEAEHYVDEHKQAEVKVLHWKTEAERYIDENEKNKKEVEKLTTDLDQANKKHVEVTKGLNSEVTSLSGKLESVSSQVKSLKNNVDEGKRRNTELQFENKTLQDRIDTRYGFAKRIKILFTGRA